MKNDEGMKYLDRNWAAKKTRAATTDLIIIIRIMTTTINTCNYNKYIQLPQ